MEKIVSKELEQEIAEADKVRAFARRRYFLDDMNDFGKIPSLVKSVIAAYNISDDKAKIEYMGDAYMLFHSMADEGGLAICYCERLDNELIKLGFPDRRDGFLSYLNSEMDLKQIRIRRLYKILIEKSSIYPSKVRRKILNRALIEKEGLCPEFLEVCTFDLYMFGFISNAEYKMITAEEENEVINHALKLRGLVGLSAEEKTRIRATWPKKGCRIDEQKEYYLRAQIALDNAFSISDKIECLAFKKYDKENVKTRARVIND